MNVGWSPRSDIIVYSHACGSIVSDGSKRAREEDAGTCFEATNLYTLVSKYG